MTAIEINSPQNQRVKNWAKFQKSNFRKNSQQFLVEGEKECLRGLCSNFEPDEIIICLDIIHDELKKELLRLIDDSCAIYLVSKPVYAKVAYRKDSEGVIGIFRKQTISLEDLAPLPNRGNLYIVLENLEKPGNLGAVLRTADATGARAILLTGKGTDPYNPNVSRASLGTVFSVPVIRTTNEDVFKWAKMNQLSIYSAALPAYSAFYDMSFDQNVVFAFGSEHDGLSDFWLSNAEQSFTLPMHGIADSLNLSVSVGVVAYEYVRRFSKPEV